MNLLTMAFKHVSLKVAMEYLHCTFIEYLMDYNTSPKDLKRGIYCIFTNDFER